MPAAAAGSAVGGIATGATGGMATGAVSADDARGSGVRAAAGGGATCAVRAVTGPKANGSSTSVSGRSDVPCITTSAFRAPPDGTVIRMT